MAMLALAGLLLLLPGPASAFDASTWTYPLRVAPSGRYLVDQRGKPFRIDGEAAWLLIANTTLEEADLYLSNRQRKGVNAIVVSLVNHDYVPGAPDNRAGDPPFLRAGDFSTPNEAYFVHADKVLQLAASKGIVVLLAPLYLGYAGTRDGWWEELQHNSPDACRSYGRFLGKRYAGQANLIWLDGGDFAPPPGSPGEERDLEVTRGIREFAAQIHTGHWQMRADRPDGALSTDQVAFAPYMELNAVYRYFYTYQYARRAFELDPPRPAFLIETTYENEREPRQWPVRKWAWWAMLDGATEGNVFGNYPIWTFERRARTVLGEKGWIEEMESPGTHDMIRLRALFDSIRWFDLMPAGLAGMRDLVTAGTGWPWRKRHIAAAATPDGSTLLAYVPPTGKGQRRFAIDLSALGGPVHARWYDPSADRQIEIAAALPNRGSFDFTTPGPNGGGDDDWVLVLEAAGQPGRALGDTSARPWAMALAAMLLVTAALAVYPGSPLGAALRRLRSKSR